LGYISQLSKIEGKLEKIYEDKLDGLITQDFWSQKHQFYINEKACLVKSLEQHKLGSNSYFETGVQLIELAQTALPLYLQRTNIEKRRILRVLSSNYLLKDEKVLPVWNTPFEHFYNSAKFIKWRGIRESNPSLIRDRDIF
jgi:site-specific DNA recombinase